MSVYFNKYIQWPWKRVRTVSGSATTTQGLVNAQYVYDVNSIKVKTHRPGLHNRWVDPTPYVRIIHGGLDSTGICYPGYIYFTNCSYKSSLDATQTTTEGNGAFKVGAPTGVPAWDTYVTSSSYWYPLLSRAQTIALLKLKSSANLAVDFGQRRQSIEQVAGIATKLAQGYRSLRKGDVLGMLRAIGAQYRHGKPMKGRPDALWLEYIYGWKPLVQDAYQIVKDLHDRDSDNPDRYRAKVTGRASNNERIPYENNAAAINGSDCPVKLSGLNTVERGVFIRLDYLLSNPLLGKDLNSYGITNPLDLAWNLLPFSFVVDWFLPIDDYLQTFDATLGWTWKAGCYTVRSVLKSEYDISPRASSGYTKCIYAYGHASMTNFQVDRRIVTSLPVNRYANVPRLKDPFSLGHLANAIALLGQAFFK